MEALRQYFSTFIQNTEAMDLKMLGWTVPSECPVQNYVDSDGVFHQRVGRVDLGSLAWTQHATVKNVFSVNKISDMKLFDNGLIANWYCTKYSVVDGNYFDSSSGSVIAMLNQAMIFIKDTSITDLVTFKNAMQGQYLYYELAEEILIKVDGNEAISKVNESLGAYDINENATGSYSKSSGFAIEWLKMCKATKGTYKLSYTINGSTGSSSEIALGKSINDKTLYRNIGFISDGIYEQIIDITSDTDIYIMVYTNGSITISNIKFTLQNIANEVGNLKNDIVDLKTNFKVFNGTTLNSTSWTYIDYPDGWDREHTIIVGVNIGGYTHQYTNEKLMFECSCGSSGFMVRALDASIYNTQFVLFAYNAI